MIPDQPDVRRGSRRRGPLRMALTGIVLALAAAFSAGYGESRVQAVREYGRATEGVVVERIDPLPFFDHGAVDVRFGASELPQFARIWLRTSPPAPAVGCRVQIFYDPADPARACLPEHCQLSRLPNAILFVVLLAGIVLTVTGFFRALRALRNRRPRRAAAPRATGLPTHPPSTATWTPSHPPETRAELVARLTAYGDLASGDDTRLHVGAPADRRQIEPLMSTVLRTPDRSRFWVILESVFVAGIVVGVVSGVMRWWALAGALVGLVAFAFSTSWTRRAERELTALTWHHTDLTVPPIRTDWSGCTLVALRPRTPGVIRPVLAILDVEVTGETRSALVTRSSWGDWLCWAPDWEAIAGVRLLEASDPALDDLRW